MQPARLTRPAPRRPLVALFLAFGLAAAATPRARGADPAYHPPIDPSLPVSSSFGEFRRNHFHGGLDFSTGGRTGLPVRAVADGFAWRVRCSGSGYGRALYLRLADGRTAVYAHLLRFAPEIEAFVEAAQESLGRYEVDLNPPPGRLPVARGAVIAWSGESGAGPPHLHFEMRDGEAADTGLNPRALGFGDADSTAPVIRRLLVTPWGPGSRVDGRAGRATRSVTRSPGGDYRLDRPLAIRGAALLAVDVIDPAPRGNRLAPFAAVLTVGGVRLYEARLERFDWNRAHEVECFYDFAEADAGRSFVLNLYRPDGASSPAFANQPAGAGRLSAAVAPGGETRPLLIELSDAAGHRARLTGAVTFEPAPAPRAGPGEASAAAPAMAVPRPSLVARPGGLLVRAPGGAASRLETAVVPPAPAALPGWFARLFRRSEPVAALEWWPLTASGDGEAEGSLPSPERFGERLVLATSGRGGPGTETVRRDTFEVLALVRGPAARLSAGPLTLALPESALFAPAWIRTGAAPADSGSGLSPVTGVWRLEAPGLVFDRPVRLAMALPPGASAERTGLFRRERDGDWSWIGNEAGPDGLGGDTRYPGDVALLRDTAPPTVTVRRPAAGAPLRDPRPAIHVEIGERGSGLGWREIECAIDGVPQIVAWDPESRTLSGRSRRTLAPGAHRLVVIARDRAGNRSESAVDFRVAR